MPNDTATGTEWERVLGRLTRAQRKAASANDQLNAAIDHVVAADTEELAYAGLRTAEQDLQMALAQVQSLLRPQLPETTDP